MIVEGFGGKMTVNSEIGAGTTLTLLLPVVESEADIAEDEDFSGVQQLLAVNAGQKPLKK